MKISLIVAVARNFVIGINGQMPWHLSADLKRFKAITMGKPIIMGRKTFESIGKPLPGRTNIVISRNESYRQQGCLVFDSLQPALDAGCSHADEVFIIGGSALFAAALPLATTLHLTEIHQDFFGDTYFPQWAREEWQMVSREDIHDDTQVSFPYSFIELTRKAT